MKLFRPGMVTLQDSVRQFINLYIFKKGNNHAIKLHEKEDFRSEQLPLQETGQELGWSP